MSDPGEGFVLGVDLGTSHTVAMLRRPGGPARPLLFDGQPLLPSAVYLDTTGRLHVGRDALRLGQAEPGRAEPHPKRHVDDGSVLLGGSAVPVSDLLAALLGAVAREAVATAGFLPPAVLTFPAGWGATRRHVLVEALGKAGWPRETRLTPEPVAAALYFADVLRRPVPAGAALAVFDFGGGTLDVAVVRNDGPGPDGRPRFTVTASGGDDNLGGLDLDAALVDHLGKSLSGAEPQAWQALTDPATLAQWRARRQLWEDVRGAKEMLSRSSFAPVPIPGVEHAVQLTRDELEAAADPLIRRGVAEAGAVIEAGGLAPTELAGLFLVGGSTRVPLVARLLHSELGIAPTVLEQPELPVAEGAALASAAVSAEPAQLRQFWQSRQGGATAATPRTVPDSPPPITDTRADRPPHTPPESALGAPAWATPAGPVPAGSVDDPREYAEPVGSVDDAREYAEPVDPWATGEAAALAAGGHGIFPGSPAVATPSDFVHPGSLGAHYPESLSTPGPSNHPNYPGSPAAPAPGGLPGTPGSPTGPNSHPNYPGSPATPTPSGQPGTPGSPTGPDNHPHQFGSPAALAPSGQPGSPESPITPAPNNHPNHPGSPAAPAPNGPPRTPGSPATPGPSNRPNYPGSPVAPAPSGRPGSPGSPTTPDPNSPPNHPGSPAAPTSSGRPGNPGSPTTPAPDNHPNHPGSPAAPAPGGQPGTPGSNNHPDYPGSPAAPESGGQLGGPGSVAASGGGEQTGGGGGAASSSDGRSVGWWLGRPRAYAMVAAAVTLVLAAGGVAAWHFWPGYRALDYRSLTDERRVPPVVAVSSSWSDAEVIGDRVYFASSDSDSGAVGVVAIEAGAKKPTWTSLEAGTAASWESMVALPSGVMLVSAADTTTGMRELAFLGADRGHRRWHRSIGSQDDVLIAGGSAVLVDRTAHRLLGLRLSDGGTRWEQADPQAGAGTPTTVIAATTPADLSGPASIAGRPLAPDLGDDPRIVQISSDRSARVLNATTGSVLASQQSVADTNDEVIAHNGRLFVRESENAQRIVSYRLDKLGDPQILYTAQGANGGLSHLTACGADRVCFVEENAYDAKTAEVVAVDAAKGGRIWRYPLAGADELVPVGTAVLAATSSDTTLIDAAGRKVTTAGAMARLDAGNVLEFAKPLTGGTQDPSLAGQHLGDDPVQLGPFSDVRADTCSWNTALVACVADQDFVMERFTK